ncbi:uncharacterized protein BN773_01154 [Prevotella sp. CAG:755]|nr:uncharacterized protein BN773_01154 [Prevotella sp. CAG:755]
MLAALALAASGTAMAQEAQTVQNGDFTETVEYSTDKFKVETNRFWSNWFVSAGGGVNLYFGDHDKQVKFGKRLAPAVDVAIGKWFTPGIGVRFAYSGLSVKGATQTGIHSTGEEVPGKGGYGYWLTKQKFNYFNFHLDAMFNVSNLLFGYNPNRVYSLSPYVGLGVMKTNDTPKATEIAGHFGLLNSFRLCDALDLNLDIRGTLVSDAFDGENSGRGGEGMLSATVGLTYKFKKRGWDKAKTVVRIDNRAINALRQQLSDAEAENERLKRALAEGNREKAKEIVTRASANLVTFPIGKATLSNEARANLGMMAEAIKSGDKSVVYTITGYADAGTGSKRINERLSKRRAEAVFNCLVKEFGVSESQLRVDHKGGVDNMFYDDPRLSRAVITKAN